MGTAAPAKFTAGALVQALAILSLALAAELILGFRISETAGFVGELVMAAALIVASALVFAPLGRSRPWLAALAVFSITLVLWAFNSALTTSLDVQSGGPYPWSGVRTMVLTVLVGPVVGAASAVVTVACTRVRRGLRKQP